MIIYWKCWKRKNTFSKTKQSCFCVWTISAYAIWSILSLQVENLGKIHTKMCNYSNLLRIRNKLKKVVKLRVKWQLFDSNKKFGIERVKMVWSRLIVTKHADWDHYNVFLGKFICQKHTYVRVAIKWTQMKCVIGSNKWINWDESTVNMCVAHPQQPLGSICSPGRYICLPCKCYYQMEKCTIHTWK